jgi:hypothetical protein
MTAGWTRLVNRLSGGVVFLFGVLALITAARSW